jgi:hypothetical protein
VQQHRPAADVERGQRTHIDTWLAGAGYPDHHGGQVGSPGQWDGAEVRAIPIAMMGRVEIGPGIADQREPADRELGAAVCSSAAMAASASLLRRRAFGGPRGPCRSQHGPLARSWLVPVIQ